MKLELKHLAPYLPYELEFQTPHLIYQGNPPEPSHEEIGTTVATLDNIQKLIEHNMPSILRPLSDLTKKIHEDEEITFLDWIISEYDFKVYFDIEENGIERLPYEIVEYLFEWHFDVFGLIEAKLAIDINTIKKDESDNKNN